MEDKDFNWIGTCVRSTKKGTRKTHEDEIDQRAFLMARLGYSKKFTEHRLKAYLNWEYEGLGKASTHKRVGTLVNAAYKRAGIGKRKN
jgi:hypothetical protein